MSISHLCAVSKNSQNPSMAYEELGEQIADLAAHIHAATYRLLQLIAQFDRSEAWGTLGFRSCAHWLNWRIGLDLITARQKVRVARALESLPKISASFERGEISYSKVRALSRIATLETEEELLCIAKAGTASHVEKFVRLYRKADPKKEMQKATEQYEGRFLNMYTDEDGMLVIQGKLPSELGAKVLKALEFAQEELYKKHDSAESSSESVQQDSVKSRPSFEQRRADALVFLADSALQNRPAKNNAHTSDRYQVVVHVDAEVLANPASDGCSCIENGPNIAVQTSQRLSCDCGVVHMKHSSDGKVLDVGRKTRTISSAIRRALRHRDKGCAFPGCTNDHFLEGHHIKHWGAGGETKLDNLLLLCPFHHRAVHEGGFQIKVDRGVSFISPDGQVLPNAPSATNLCAHPIQKLKESNSASGLNISNHTLPAWAGEIMDYDWALGCFVKS